jgi:hypothetical protein
MLTQFIQNVMQFSICYEILFHKRNTKIKAAEIQ